MKVLVTGANGFIGRHLVARLNNLKDMIIYEVGKHTTTECYEKYCSDCDFVYHLAGVNKSLNNSDFTAGNVELTDKLLTTLKKYQNRCPVLYSSSIHAILNTPYGISKKTAEDRLQQYEKDTGAKVYIYRFPNVFGSGCRPNYNSVIATFCHNIARGLAIKLDDPCTVLGLSYVDDLTEELLQVLTEKVDQDNNDYCAVKEVKQDNIDYYVVKEVNHISLSEIAELLSIFQKSQEGSISLTPAEPFIKKLHNTFLSYLPNKQP